MRNNSGLKPWLLAILTSLALSATPLPAKEKEKPGYAVDGRTSASVLSAKRSHEVPKEQETGLAIYSGLMVIAIIGFFSTKLFEKK